MHQLSDNLTPKILWHRQKLEKKLKSAVTTYIIALNTRKSIESEALMYHPNRGNKGEGRHAKSVEVLAWIVLVQLLLLSGNEQRQNWLQL